MISVDLALEKILARVERLPSETVPLGRSLGRVLARGAKAHIDNPAFDVSAMDGYALRADDVNPGSTLDLIGVSQAGSAFHGTVGQGQCIRIFTGAPVPSGADAVVMQEDVNANDDRITFNTDAQSGRNIRRRGEDFRAGRELASQGTALTAHNIGLIAAGNNSTIEVSSLPSIGLLATGDELVPPGTALGSDQIVSSNTIALSALLCPFASTMTDHGIVADDKDALERTLRSALDAEPDLLITTGGASVGEHDLVQDALGACGVTMDFWRIAMRPGKPLMFGAHGKTLVFGLPGNPVSALVTARIFILPALKAMTGALSQDPLLLPLAAPLPANGPRRHYLRARLERDAQGHTTVDPIRQTDSGHLSSLASAEAMIIQRENCQGMSAGDYIETILL